MPENKPRISLTVTSLVLAVLVLHQASSHASELYFRYVDDAGVTVIDSLLPPAYAKSGYEIIDNTGRVVDKIAPQATAAELAVNRKERERLRLIDEQRKKDELLLSRYSSVDDIEASQNRVVDEITLRLSILRGNLRSIKSQIERQQEKAANSERAGRPVPQSLVANINTMEAEVDDTRVSITARKQEIVEVKQKFAKDIERFAYLQDLRYGRIKHTAKGPQQKTP